MDAIIAAEGLTVSAGGRDALLGLSGGDMRRVLNVMQACHMAFPKGIDEKAVYLCTGSPLPDDMARYLHLLLNESFKVAFAEVRSSAHTSGYALSDILREVTVLVLAMGLPGPVLAQLLDDMSTLEWRLAAGASEKVQLAALVGAFMVARESMTP